MQILSFLRSAMNKKGRTIFGSLLFFMCIVSCSKDLTNYGRVTFYGANSKNFTFFVSEEYLRANRNSGIDKNNPKLTKAEAELLNNILEHKSYCVNDKGKTIFRITSKQEKIYDMTFAHLIEQNYNARPVTPVIYYGECLSRPINQKEALKQVVEETKASIK